MFYSGALVREPETGNYYRVVQGNPARILLMPIGIPHRWVVSLERSSCETKVKSGVWTLESPNVSQEAADGTVKVSASSSLAAAAAEQVHARLFSGVADLCGLSTSSGRARLFDQLKESDKSLSKSTFYKHLRRYLEGGLTIASLEARWGNGRIAAVKAGWEDIDLEVAKQEVRAQSLKLQAEGPLPSPNAIEFSTTKAGKRRQRAPAKIKSGFNAGPAALKVFNHFYKMRLSNVQMSMQTAYDCMRDQVFSTTQPYGAPLRWPLWAIPSLDTFKRYWREIVPHSKRSRAEHGDHAFDTTMRAVAQSVSRAFAAGRIGEIDATIFPVELRSEEPGAPIIGPAVAFRIRCRDTGQLLGISTSLESAGWIGAAMAIANCLEDKKSYCESLGLGEMFERLPWVGQGLPAELVADMGETYNDKVKPFVRLTGTSVSNLPAARPDLKGGIESDWEVLQIKLEEVTPGAKIRRFEEERGQKWEIKGNMTLRDFTRMLVIEELIRMHRPRPSKSLPQSMVIAGVDTSPHSMFTWSLKHGGGGLKQVDTLATRLSLLPRRTASITQWGVTVKDWHFVCAPTSRDEAHAIARSNGRRTVTVAWDPLLIDNVWLLVGGDADAPKEYVRCPLDMRFRDQTELRGKTWREAERTLYDGQLINVTQREARDEHFAYAQRLKEELAAKARAETEEQRAQVPKSQAQLKREQLPARLREKDRTSPQLAVTSGLAAQDDEVSDAKPNLFVVGGTQSTISPAASAPAPANAEKVQAASKPARSNFFAQRLARARQETK